MIRKRLRTNVKLTPKLIEHLQVVTNLGDTISVIQDKYPQADFGDLFDSYYSRLESIANILKDLTNMQGKIDKDLIKFYDAEYSEND